VGLTARFAFRAAAPDAQPMAGGQLFVDDAYDRYVRAEWELFARDPARSAASRNAVRSSSITRVLDIGCGAGQELRPFLQNARTFGVGIDVSPEAGLIGRELFKSAQPGSRVGFVRAAAENLPLRAATFEVVVCRLALPYTDNARALAEVARVLRPTGTLLLKFHHARYYAEKLGEALWARHFRSAVHACRVLLAGCLYHVTGSQPRGRITGGETFQTMWLLRRELGRHGLEIRDVLGDSVPAAPSLLIMRGASEPAPAVRET
jgi:SAM-dependent methyltransferase